MAYSIEKWILSKADIELKSRVIEILYFFSRRMTKRVNLCDLQNGYTYSKSKGCL